MINIQEIKTQINDLKQKIDFFQTKLENKIQEAEDEYNESVVSCIDELNQIEKTYNPIAIEVLTKKIIAP